MPFGRLGFGLGFNTRARSLGGAAPFNPNSILGLQQLLFVNEQASLSGYITDERTGLGDDRALRGGRVYDFDGVDDFAGLGARLTSGVLTNLTACAWIKVAGNSDTIFGEYNATTTNRAWTAYVTSSGKLEVVVSEDGGTTNFKVYTTTENVNTGAWVHIAFTFAPNDLKLYINGAVVSPTLAANGTVNSILDSAIPFEIGRLNQTTTFQFAGLMRDVRVYNVTKDASAIAAIHAGDYDAPDATGLVGGYYCNEEDGTTSYDWSGNGNHGTITNATLASFHAVDATADNSADIVGHGLLQTVVGNGTFDTDTVWSKESGATIVGGVGVFSGGPSERLRQDVLTIGETYSVTVEIVSYTSGAPAVQLGTTNLALPTSVGVHTVSGTCVGAILFGVCGQSSVCTVDNVVVQPTSQEFIIPRDESDTANDVLGNALEFTGEAPNPGQAVNSPCLTLDGSDDYIAAAHLSGSETVVRSGGTSTPSVSAGRIDFTAGTCWDLELSDGTYYPLCENSGTTAYDVSGNGDNGTLTNMTTSPAGAGAWANTQDVFHYALSKGFTIPLQDPSNTDLTTWTATSATVTGSQADPDGGTGAFLLTNTGGAVGSGTAGLIRLVGDHVLGESYVVEVWAKAASAGDIALGGYFGDVPLTPITTEWAKYRIIVDGAVNTGFYIVDFRKTGTTLSSVTVYAPQLAVYQFEVPALADGTLDAQGNTISNPKRAGHNGGLTELTWDGGTWSFNDAPADDSEFIRTLTSSSVEVAADRFAKFDRVLTGTDLTNMETYTETTEI